MSFDILLTTESEIKIDAVKTWFSKKFGKTVNIKGVNCDGCKLPKQPIIDELHDLGHSYHFAKERMNFVRRKENFNNYDYVISIENAIDSNHGVNDKCFVLMYSKGIFGHGESIGIPFDIKYFTELEKDYKMVEYSNRIYGYDCTIGEIINKHDDSIDPKNWMEKICGVDRRDQIRNAMDKAYIKLCKYNDQKNQLLAAYKSYNNFPKEGVLFHDIWELFKDPDMLRLVIKFIVNQYRYDNIKYVVGLESRGFCLGIAVALKLKKVGFKSVRKVGKEKKLPGEVIEVSYTKEYGTDVFQMQLNASERGSNVLIIDDLIATGGSMQAAIDLSIKAEFNIVDCCVLRNVPELQGECNKTMKAPYTVLLQKN